MSWRRTVPSGVLAAGLTQACLASPFESTAWADNDHDHPWYHGHRWYRAHSDDHDGHHRRWWHEHRDYDGRVQGDNTRDCRAIRERIRYDHEQARVIEATGRHKKALQWYKDDIQKRPERPPHLPALSWTVALRQFGSLARSDSAEPGGSTPRVRALRLAPRRS